MAVDVVVPVVVPSGVVVVVDVVVVVVVDVSVAGAVDVPVVVVVSVVVVPPQAESVATRATLAANRAAVCLLSVIWLNRLLLA